MPHRNPMSAIHTYSPLTSQTRTRACPHTYGVRVCPCAAFATEPCRPTACIPLAHPPAVPCPLTPVRWTFTFSAKEKDTETGFSYFGSRYYNSDLSIWLSVDPQASKYPSLSPFVYCANNPIKLVDPNGKEIYVEIEGKTYKYNGYGLVGKDGYEFIPASSSFEGRVLKDLNSLRKSKNSMIRGKMNDLIKSKHSHTIKLSFDSDDFNHTLNAEDAKTPGKGSGTITYYNPFSEKNNCVDGDRLSSAVLAHELLGHGWNKDNGLYDEITETANGIRYEEINAINVQNLVLKENGLHTRTAIGHDEQSKVVIPGSELNNYFTPKP